MYICEAPSVGLVKAWAGPPASIARRGPAPRVPPPPVTWRAVRASHWPPKKIVRPSRVAAMMYLPRRWRLQPATRRRRGGATSARRCTRAVEHADDVFSAGPHGGTMMTVLAPLADWVAALKAALLAALMAARRYLRLVASESAPTSGFRKRLQT